MSNPSMREMRFLVRHLWRRGERRTAVRAVLTMPRYAIANGWRRLWQREPIVVHVHLTLDGKHLADTALAVFRERAQCQLGSPSRWSEIQ